MQTLLQQSQMHILAFRKFIICISTSLIFFTFAMSCELDLFTMRNGLESRKSYCCQIRFVAL